MRKSPTPYQSLPRESFWRVASSAWKKGRFDNIYKPKFPITPETAIASAGSCFAQHIGRYLKNRGFNYIDAEPAPFSLSDDTLSEFGYGLFSARYGNIYTSRQLSELVRDAFLNKVHDEVWEEDGRFFDPFRPTIEPNGFASREEVIAMRYDHLKAIRQLLRKTEVFIFTLGLTESWYNTETGYTYQICPGTTAGRFDPDRHAFRNLDTSSVVGDLKRFIKRCRSRNRDVKILLTVSPVPLVATATGDHVVAATGHSKAVLRAAAGQLRDAYNFVDYFPSYEIISSHLSSGAGYAEDLRDVRDDAVAEVMDVFFSAHGIDSSEERTAKETVAEKIDREQRDLTAEMSAVCDELSLDDGTTV